MPLVQIKGVAGYLRSRNRNSPARLQTLWCRLKAWAEQPSQMKTCDSWQDKTHNQSEAHCLSVAQ